MWDEVVALATAAVTRCGIYALRNGDCGACKAKRVPIGAGVWAVEHTADCPIQRSVRVESFVKRYAILAKDMG